MIVLIVAVILPSSTVLADRIIEPDEVNENALPKALVAFSVDGDGRAKNPFVILGDPSWHWSAIESLDGTVNYRSDGASSICRSGRSPSISLSTRHVPGDRLPGQ